MTSFIQTRVHGNVAEIVLDRPRALNALDASMIRDIHAALVQWRDDDAIAVVLVTSSSERAFCAGGDIKSVRQSALDRDHNAVHKFFSTEYQLNALIANYPKPYVALIDGHAMGGGLGISVHGSIRVVTEKAGLAMPETAIGFFPDVGASYFLPRLTGATGMYLGLTGARASGADAVVAGLATHFVPSDKLDALADEIRAIRSGGDVVATIERHATEAPASEMADQLDEIDRVFGSGSVADMVARLTGDDEWTKATREALATVAPSSLWITAELVRRGADLTLEQCLDLELALGAEVTRNADFIEGVRAVLVDKDRNPSWNPPSVDDIDAEAIEALFTEVTAEPAE
ncbi:enoyl-CoA hydratase/isomerase family protein [Rhodococcus sp. TAF43]|uniref:enoyl-CoA hydratase/isomerase family protein n=1 Tax=unclassified Rhodococcus (in: high G+C Gram-positive bacteria) TaxID=192944 RepID=UPI00158351CB|nr:enoyl-CoA hydratase/isomerase family protein [Rhodococcus sp. W8901]QKT10578.1 enoyl-CoA hydratase/isomerase family protein [Rhodococcus sp. W8901]